MVAERAENRDLPTFTIFLMTDSDTNTQRMSFHFAHLATKSCTTHLANSIRIFPWRNGANTRFLSWGYLVMASKESVVKNTKIIDAVDNMPQPLAISEAAYIATPFVAQNYH